MVKLEVRSKSVMVIPYKHPKVYKDEIEKIIRELLDIRFIQPRFNPFASSMVLVKKRYEMMRMCINYMLLNNKNIKNRYSISRVHDLIDDFHRVRYFSKIDLKLGDHQIQMKEEDIHKKNFKYHYSHLKFLVMPFELTNAPATFQLDMN